LKLMKYSLLCVYFVETLAIVIDKITQH
jgi:hypothetical protein